MTRSVLADKTAPLQVVDQGALLIVEAGDSHSGWTRLSDAGLTLQTDGRYNTDQLSATRVRHRVVFMVHLIYFMRSSYT